MVVTRTDPPSTVMRTHKATGYRAGFMRTHIFALLSLPSDRYEMKLACKLASAPLLRARALVGEEEGAVSAYELVETDDA